MRKIENEFETEIVNEIKESPLPVLQQGTNADHLLSATKRKNVPKVRKKSEMTVTEKIVLMVVEQIVGKAVSTKYHYPWTLSSLFN